MGDSGRNTMINFNFLKNIFSSLVTTNLNKKYETEKVQQRHELPVSGEEDDITYRVKELEKEALSQTGHILCNGQYVLVEGSKVVQKFLPSNCFKKVKTERAPQMAVVHWDAALSSDSCYNVLKSRGISTHFSIDNDGTIYQFADTNDITWHAGPVSQDISLLSAKGIKVPKGLSWNNISIGIDISNAYYTKYASVYEKRGFPPRPVIKSRCHGMKLEHLGYYPEQTKSFTKLITALCNHYDIPLTCPIEDGKLVETIYKPACLGQFKGVVNHFHLTTNKIDTSGFPLQEIMENVQKEEQK